MNLASYANYSLFEVSANASKIFIGKNGMNMQKRLSIYLRNIANKTGNLIRSIEFFEIEFFFIEVIKTDFCRVNCPYRPKITRFNSPLAAEINQFFNNFLAFYKPYYEIITAFSKFHLIYYILK